MANINVIITKAAESIWRCRFSSFFHLFTRAPCLDVNLSFLFINKCKNIDGICSVQISVLRLSNKYLGCVLLLRFFVFFKTRKLLRHATMALFEFSLITHTRKKKEMAKVKIVFKIRLANLAQTALISYKKLF